MNILHINASDVEGGAAKAARRVHLGLRQIGVESGMYVQRKHSSSTDVVKDEPSTALGRQLARLRPLVDSAGLVFYPHRKTYNWNVQWLPSGVAARVRSLEPSVVHLHWICGGFVPIQALRHFDRPMLWTIHDSWPFTGGCHCPQDCLRYREQCGRCPLLASDRERDLSRCTWQRKHRHWQDLDLTIVSPSRWLAARASESSLFRKLRIEAIPNGIDTDLYKPTDREVARGILGLRRDRKLILFAAMNATRDSNKGADLLLAAARALSSEWRERAEVVVLGNAEGLQDDSGLPVRTLGTLRDEASMVLAYSAADVTVVPSRQENLPNTVMESQACGTPVVAFRVGGIPELIDHWYTGYLATPFDTTELASGLSFILSDDRRRREWSSAAREKVEREFEFRKVAGRYLKLYEELVEKGEQRT